MKQFATTPKGSKRKRPQNCVWTHQVIRTLSWIRSFLKSERGAISRTWILRHYLAEDADLLFLFDACPWGLGGILVERGVIVSYFISQLTEADARHLKITIGEASAQQAAECMAVLVGLRAWKRHWLQRRCSFALKGDNKTALNMALTLRGPPGAVKTIARELSFTYSSAAFEPKAATHIPGVANVVSDKLSRRYEPSQRLDWRLPSCLQHVPKEKLARRDASFWKV